MHFFTKKIDPELGIKLNNSMVLKFLNKYSGHPENVEECNDILSEHKNYYEEGLTKPWV